MELNIEKFSPKKAELLDVSKKYLFLEIKGIDDKQGYMVVGEARKDLKRNLTSRLINRCVANCGTKNFRKKFVKK